MKNLKKRLLAMFTTIMILTNVAIAPIQAEAETFSTQKIEQVKEPATEEPPTDATSQGKDSPAAAITETPNSSYGMDNEGTANANDSPNVSESPVTDESEAEVLTVGPDGAIYYKGEPLFIKGSDDVPANLEELMKQGVATTLRARSSFGTAAIQFLGYISWGPHTVGDFRVNGKQAFCIEHPKPTPPTGTPNTGTSIYDNVKIQAVLYWGWGGPKNIFSDASEGIVFTSLALSKYYYGDEYQTLTANYRTLIAKAEAGDVPKHGMQLNGTNNLVKLPVTIKNGKQVSATASLNADSSNHIEYTVPAGITYVCENTGATGTNRSVKIYGGQRFHFEADLRTTKTVAANKLNGIIQAFQPLIVKPVNSGYQTIGTWRWYDDPAQTISFQADFITRTGLGKVIKTDDNSHSVPGALFRFENLTTGETKELRTDEKGNCAYEALHGDRVKITELEAPTGYLLVEGQTKTLTIEAGQTQNGEFVNPKMTIKTTASDHEDGDTKLSPEKKVTIKDKIAYTNLFTDGREYVVKGVLMDKATGKPLEVNKKQITIEKSFVPKEKDGFVEVSFTLDATALAGKTVVVFETLYQEDKEILIHADIEDKGQTVTFDSPRIGTTATNPEDKSQVFDPEEKVTLKDTVAYSDLQIGKTYKLRGLLMDKTTGKPLSIEGKQVTAETIFSPKKADGTVDVTFIFDARELKGKELVVFETLSRQRSDSKEWMEVTKHADIKDKGQTVRITNPEIQTSAINPEDDSKLYDPLQEVTLVDTVAFKDLVVGRKYTVKGKLMDKATGEPLLIDEAEVTSETTFIAKTTAGSVEVVFTLNASQLHGKTIVVFETLHKKETQIAIHADIEDEDQTVAFTDPKIGTTALDDDSKSHLADALEEVTLTDIVAYEDLIDGKQYTLNGILMDKETGEPLLVEDEEITGTVTFIAREGEGEIVEATVEDGSEKEEGEDAPAAPLEENIPDEDEPEAEETDPRVSGTVSVSFTLNAKELQGKEVVVFESLVREETEIALHADIEDVGQTIRFNEPELKTTATINGEKTATTSNKMVIKDSVNYTNLTPGKEYKVSGVLMDKATNRPYLVKGKEITAEKIFIPENREGTVEIDFVFDGSGITASKELVVFEDLYRDELLLATHADIQDTAQTVTLLPPAKYLPQTGEKMNLCLLLVFAFLLFGAGIAFCIYDRKHPE